VAKAREITEARARERSRKECVRASVAARLRRCDGDTGPQKASSSLQGGVRLRSGSPVPQLGKPPSGSTAARVTSGVPWGSEEGEVSARGATSCGAVLLRGESKKAWAAVFSAVRAFAPDALPDRTTQNRS
jgi:hypothetical protein